MRRYVTHLAASVVVCTLAVAILPINAEPTTPDTLLTIVYPVADLPVYRAVRGEEPEFNPDLLISLMKAKVDPDSWEERAAISVPDRTDSLIIRQTRANHQRIAELLARFRKPDPREETETISQYYDRVRTDVLNAIFRAERQREIAPEKAIALINVEIGKVKATDLSERQKTSLLNSLKRSKEAIQQN